MIQIDDLTYWLRRNRFVISSAGKNALICGKARHSTILHLFYWFQVIPFACLCFCFWPWFLVIYLKLRILNSNRGILIVFEFLNKQ